MNKIKPNIEELQLIQVPRARLCVNKHVEFVRLSNECYQRRYGFKTLAKANIFENAATQTELVNGQY